MAQADGLAPFLLAGVCEPGSAEQAAYRLVFCPSRANLFSASLPRACALGWILPPLRGSHLGANELWGNCGEMADDVTAGIGRRESPASRKRREKWGTQLCLEGGTTANI